MKSFLFFNFSHLDFVTFEAGKLTKFFGEIAPGLRVRGRHVPSLVDSPRVCAQFLQRPHRPPTAPPRTLSGVTIAACTASAMASRALMAGSMGTVSVTADRLGTGFHEKTAPLKYGPFSSLSRLPSALGH